MSEEFSLYDTKRRVLNGYEIVTHRFKADSLYLIKIISSGTKEQYKQALAEISGYPLEEWTRIKEVVPVRQENGDYFIEVWFRNPGKQFEQFLRTLHGKLDFDALHINGHLTLEASYHEQTHIDKDALSYLDG